MSLFSELMTDGPWSLYRFADLTDASGNGRSMTIASGWSSGASVGGASFLPGDPDGNSAHFNGNSYYGWACPDTTELTISYWAVTSAPDRPTMGNYPSWFGGAGNTNGSFHSPLVIQPDYSGYVVGSSGQSTDGQPHHIAYRWTSLSAVKIYLDGVEVASGTCTRTGTGSGGSFGGYGGTPYFDGDIQALAVYDHALDPARILAHATAGMEAPLAPPGQPTGISMNIGNSYNVGLSWTPPADAGDGLTGYITRIFDHNGYEQVTSFINAPAVGGGAGRLLPSYEGPYTITMTSVGPGGLSDPTDPLEFTIAPGPPRFDQPTVDGTSVTVTWDALINGSVPGTGGSPVTGYTVRLLDSGDYTHDYPAADDATSLTIPDLAPGPYVLTMCAENATGTGDFQDYDWEGTIQVGGGTGGGATSEQLATAHDSWWATLHNGGWDRSPYQGDIKDLTLQAVLEVPDLV